jgi:hypothetical protein
LREEKHLRFILALLALLLATQAEARTHHRHHFPSTRTHELVHARFNTPYPQFAALAADFEAMGYAIGTPGCLSAGHMRHSKHHWGGACDFFNQIARDRTALRQPPPAVQIAMALKHGLVSGCMWRNRDCGHYEIPSRRF